MNTMTNIDTKSSWELTGIEYSGLGDKPYFILHDGDGNVKLHPVGRGITDLRKTLNLEEE
jgi:hypothetical protein